MFAPDLDLTNYELRPIVVARKFQGTAVAHDLIIHVESILKEMDEKEYFLKVRIDNTRAVNFYQKMGFVTAAIENETRYIMVKKLAPRNTLHL